jgi:hypothetical protein
MPRLGEIQSPLGFLCGIGSRRCSRRLANAKAGKKTEKQEEGPNRQEKSAHKKNKAGVVDACLYHTASIIQL